MKQYKLTFIGLAVALAMLILIFGMDIELFELFIESLHSLEHHEIDEFIIPLFVFGSFALLDKSRRQKERSMEYEKVKIYKAMLASSYHILNNFLNQIQLFKITAQKTPGFNPRILDLYEKVVASANTQLEALGNISDIDESSIHSSVAPKPDE